MSCCPIAQVMLTTRAPSSSFPLISHAVRWTLRCIRITNFFCCPPVGPSGTFPICHGARCPRAWLNGCTFIVVATLKYGPPFRSLSHTIFLPLPTFRSIQSIDEHGPHCFCFLLVNRLARNVERLDNTALSQPMSPTGLSPRPRTL